LGNLKSKINSHPKPIPKTKPYHREDTEKEQRTQRKYHQRKPERTGIARALHRMMDALDRLD
jgi:hypothetical protein